MGKSINMGYFFQNQDKLKKFANFYELNARHFLLQDLQLGLSVKRGSNGEADSAI